MPRKANENLFFSKMTDESASKYTMNNAMVHFFDFIISLYPETAFLPPAKTRL
jgi:hypothetical protein